MWGITSGELGQALEEEAPPPPEGQWQDDYWAEVAETQDQDLSDDRWATPEEDPQPRRFALPEADDHSHEKDRDEN